jgi:hypothetical protein
MFKLGVPAFIFLTFSCSAVRSVTHLTNLDFFEAFFIILI